MAITLFPQKAPSLSVKQFGFLPSAMASKTAEMLDLEQWENLLLLSLSPEVAEANMM